MWALTLLAIALTVTGLWAILVTPRLRQFHDGDAALGMLQIVARVHARLVHRLRIEGQQQLEGIDPDTPLLIVANHTGAVDPFLIQQAMPSRMLHWMMARDMMWGSFDDIWKLARVIPVDRTKADSTALRSALRMLKAGHCVGIFPEGRITRPPGTIRPFMDGLGMLATRTGATIVPVLISGTPDTDNVMASLFRPSHTHLKVLEPMQLDRSMTPAQAAAAIRKVMVAASGWPAVDIPMPLELGDA